MYEMEMLDRSLLSLQRTEEAYTDINDRIIENVNIRKERLNDLNNRLANMSEKILALYNVNQAMRILSPAQYPMIDTMNDPKYNPHQSMFYEKRDLNEVEIENNFTKDMPELSSLQIKKKIFNNRLQNDIENLKKIIPGATKDISEISSMI
mmetsp:Transcript_7268/g.6406  ORF Transcript_7268/g.6406 Transcript_7268/m.6406 type:complete len:151 (+) Transcript_7268:120-572(+)